MKRFWLQFGGAGGRGRGLLDSSDSAENGEWVQSRPAPLAGVRRILRATPFAAGPFWLLGVAICEAWCFFFNILGTHYGTLGAA